MSDARRSRPGLLAAGLLAVLFLVVLTPTAGAAPVRSPQPDRSGGSAPAAPALRARPPIGIVQAVDCASGDNCRWMGVSSAGDTPKVLAGYWINGKWGMSPVPTPPNGQFVAVTGLECPTVSRCYATLTRLTTEGTSSFIATFADGVWTQKRIKIPRGETSLILRDVACVAKRAAQCVAVGQTVTETEAGQRVGRERGRVLVMEPDGSWTYRRLPAVIRTRNTVVTGAGCPNAGEFSGVSGCYAVGMTDMSEPFGLGVGSLPQLAGADLTFIEGPADAVGNMDDVDCGSGEKCTASGILFNEMGQVPMIVPFTGEGFAEPSVMPAIGGTSFTIVEDLTCFAADRCRLAVTGSTTGGARLFVVSVSTATETTAWSTVQLPLPAGAASATFGALTCRSAKFCAGGGTHNASDGQFRILRLLFDAGWQVFPAPA